MRKKGNIYKIPLIGKKGREVLMVYFGSLETLFLKVNLTEILPWQLAFA